MQRFWVVLLMIFGLATSGAAETLRVPEEYPTVRLALEAAAHGDTVQVAGGTVVREVYFRSHNIVLIGAPILGGQFRAFVARVNAAATGNRAAIVDSFMSAAAPFPFREEGLFCYFIYRGSAASVGVPGDFNGWNQNAPAMSRLADTNLWYREAVFESTARLDYKLVRNGSEWILDPHNPRTVPGGFGPNSELAMPEYVQPPEIVSDPGVPKGTLHDTLFTSSILGNTRRIRVYTPPGYESAPADSFPLMLFHDGLEYISLANAPTILDNLIAAGRIRPLIGIFVPPVDRNNEYAFSRRLLFEQFIADEVMPMVAQKFRIFRDPATHAMTGPSFGGLITTQICYNRPEVFGLAAPYSPSYWANGRTVFTSVAAGETRSLKFYLDWGTYEPSIMEDGRLMREVLRNKGYEVNWNEWYEGHSWGSWRAHLDEALEFFFSAGALGVEDPPVAPQAFQLDQNFPNPFNPETHLRFRIAGSGWVELQIFDLNGRRVRTLLQGQRAPGEYILTWDGRSDDGRQASSGVYFSVLRVHSPANVQTATGKMLLIR